MSISPELVGAAAIAGTVAVGAGYSYLTGRRTEVNIDNDPEPEMVFGGEDGEEDESNAENHVEAEGAVAEYKAAPQEVRDIGQELAAIKGIGDTRADQFEKKDFHTASDLYFASDEELKQVKGVGDLTVSQIREDIGSVEDESDDDDAGNESNADEAEKSTDEASTDQSDDGSSSTETDSGTDSESENESTQSDSAEGDGEESSESDDS